VRRIFWQSRERFNGGQRVIGAFVVDENDTDDRALWHFTIPFDPKRNQPVIITLRSSLG